MKILLVHNNYKCFGGEDNVLQAENWLLANRGHHIFILRADNNQIHGFLQQSKTAFNAYYSKSIKSSIFQKIRDCKPKVVQVHNFFPLLTPSVYDACIEAGVPVVQTLHNYRTICPGALLMRDGKICEKCICGSPYHAVLHRCYRKSSLGSWAVARMVAYHRKKQTWQNKVDRFIALTQFGKQKFIEAGFPENKIMVKPNFYNQELEVGNQQSEARKGALFVGRMSREKGVATLFAACQQGLEIPLRVAGDGPLHMEYQEQQMPHVEFLGRLTAKQVSREMQRASFLVMPSVWYEGFPMVLVEAFAHRLPVVASRLGSMAEIVEDGITGLHFEPGNPKDLAQKVQWMHDHPEESRRMGDNARRVYEEKYTPERNYQMLMDIYRQAIEEKRSSGKRS